MGRFFGSKAGFTALRLNRPGLWWIQRSENKIKGTVMKKLILLAGTALVLAGCNQGGTSDEYNSDTGTGNSASTNYNTSDSYSTNSSGLNSGGATSPGGMNSGSSSSGNTDTNSLNSGSTGSSSSGTGANPDANQPGGGTGTP
jgi:hypothetical protein